MRKERTKKGRKREEDEGERECEGEERDQIRGRKGGWNSG